jgi:hypothetical protein
MRKSLHIGSLRNPWRRETSKKTENSVPIWIEATGEYRF